MLDERVAPTEFQLSKIIESRLKRDLIEKKIFEPGERTFGVDFSALQEDVAVALEVVARRAGPQTQAVLADAVHQTNGHLEHKKCWH